jgi:hypothetical protein
LTAYSERLLIDGRVNSSFPTKSFVTAAAVIVAIYFAVFYGIEGCRAAKGPWRVTFATSNDVPQIDILQTRLNISQQIRIQGETVALTNLPQIVIFDRPKKSAPFGRVIYEDLTQLPGVITFDLFGHEIELVPRTLVVNKRQIPWGSQPLLELWPTNKPAEPPKPAPGWK